MRTMTDTLNLLVYYWTRTPEMKPLTSVNSETIKVISTGKEYSLSDRSLFLNSKIIVNGVEKVGAVKIVESSIHWMLWDSDHKESVILVLVRDIQQPIVSVTSENINVVKITLPHSLIHSYNELIYMKEHLCGLRLKNYNSIYIENFLSRLMIERLETKCKYIDETYASCRNSWSDTAYYMLFDTISISNKRNREQFCQLLKNIDYGNIIRMLISYSNTEMLDIKENLMNIEALLFGTAGLLHKLKFDVTSIDSYTYTLREKFDIMKRRFNIQVMDSSLWNYGGVGSADMLSSQLSQLASIIAHNTTLHFSLINVDSLEKIKCIFNVPTGSYWNDHTSLSIPSVNKKTRVMSTTKIDIFIINFVIPYLLYYNTRVSDAYNDTLCDTLLTYLNKIDAENNSLVTKWKPYIKIDSAFASQAMIQLIKIYCTPGRCTECQLGKEKLREASLETV